MKKGDEHILWFKQLGIEDIPLVGGKNASLGEMYQNLVRKGINIPNGFAITSTAYKYFIQKNHLDEEIRKLLKGLNTKNVKDLAEKARKIRSIITQAEIPPDLKKEITTSYYLLSKENKQEETDVAVRSSATAEDLPNASFAGQQETFLNIRGEHELLDACKKCFASLFTDRAIVYRQEKGFDHFRVYLSIGIQKMVRSDLASSGVMFTLDTETGFKNAVLINGSYGLGENIVQGQVTPDEYYIFKLTLDKYNPIISKKLGDKKIRMIYGVGGVKTIKNVDVTIEERKKFCITDQEALQLARWAVIIEEYYSEKKKKYTPMDIEWAKDGISEKIFIVQARPETVQSQKESMQLEEYQLLKKGKVLTSGRSIGSKIGSGKANVIRHVKDIEKFRVGEVLVTEMTDPDWVVIMRQASAIVTNKGGSTSHAAIVSRELGIPCIVGTNNATEIIKYGQKITVSCAEGEVGKVYEGILSFKIKKTNLKELPKTKTKIMVNLGNPQEAFKYSFLPVNGVGLAREEFIINESIKIHPLALINFEKLKDEEAKTKIQELTSGYKNKKEFFIDKLAMGVGMIASAFYPNDVIVRLSDFKSNEYANLIGGKEFEPKEENPMIGWRGASRYYSTEYKEAFILECQALKKAREKFGLFNIKIMIPMCRTTEEGKKILEIMSRNGLIKGKNGLEVYVMCEVPSNIILAEEFCKIFDGFSIGSNDLTQLTLGVDRDSSLVAHVFNERNPAVLKMIEQVIKVAKKNGKKIGICGDAPSTYEEFARFLVQCGINSISLSPDAVIKTLLVVADEEKKL